MGNDKNIQEAFSSRVFAFTLPLLFGLIIVLLSVWGLWQSKHADVITVTEFSPLSYVSMLLFVITCLLGLYSNKSYFACLIFVLLAFPAPVNDFFPGTYLGPRFELGASIFPFFTHIDIYLFIGIVKGVVLNRRVNLKMSLLFLCVLLGMFISIVVNFFQDGSKHDLVLLIQGLFQFRYLILLFFLLSLYDIEQYKNFILIGMVASVLFLFAESIAFTIKSNANALMSGSLANNTFASITASILLFLYYVRKKYSHSKLYRKLLTAAIILCAVIVIGTKARMAILALVVCYFAVSFIENRQYHSLKAKLSWVGACILFIVAVKLVADKLPSRYNPNTITDKIEIREPNWDLTKFVHIEHSWETNSLITRLQLYTTSLNMIREHPLTGVGVGRWNQLKHTYGFRERLLIDSHNGYLSVLSQYGILGLPLIIFIYFFPIYMIFRNSGNYHVNYSFLVYISVINLYISFADLSNSGVFKHQIFSFLAFNAICLMKLYKPQERRALSLADRDNTD